MIYISDKLSYILSDDLESQNVESIWIELTPKICLSHLICVVYRRSEHLFTHWSDAFNEQLTNAYIDCSNITLMGDYNVYLLKKSNESKSLLNITENFQFCQLIDEPA